MKIKKFLVKHKITLSFIFLFFSMSLFLLLCLISDSDYFWHIKAGEYIFNNGLLKEDVFSWYVNGKYWMSHEWLYELVLYSLKYLFGNFHMLIYSFVCTFLLFLILFFANRKGYEKNISFSLIWIILFLILIGFIQARPHLFSFNLLALTIWFLYDLYKNEDSKKIYFLPLIAILWSNVHGGSSNLIYLFCFIFFVIGLFKFNFGKIKADRFSKKQLLKYLLVGIICIGCISINIHGVKMLVYPYENMANSVMLNNITEWQPTNLNIMSHYLYFILLFVICITMLISKKKIELIDLILLGISIFLGLKSIRFWSYTYIIMSFLIFNYVNSRKYDKGSTLCICTVGIIFIGLFIFNYGSIKDNINTRMLSDNIIESVKSESPKRLYNMYNYGGELIYNDIDVFIDGRADLYSKYNYVDYLNISKLEKDYVKLIDKYNFDYFLVDKEYPIYTYLKYNDDYEKIIENKNVILYKKNS